MDPARATVLRRGRSAEGGARYLGGFRACQAQLGDCMSLTSVSAYREFDSLYSSGEGTPLAVTLQANRIYHHQFSQELRLNGKLGERLNYTLGGYYFDKRSENARASPCLRWSGSRMT